MYLTQCFLLYLNQVEDSLMQNGNRGRVYEANRTRVGVNYDAFFLNMYDHFSFCLFAYLFVSCFVCFISLFLLRYASVCFVLVVVSRSFVLSFRLFLFASFVVCLFV
jgi:hypothetical protein